MDSVEAFTTKKVKQQSIDQRYLFIYNNTNLMLFHEDDEVADCKVLFTLISFLLVNLTLFKSIIIFC